MTNYAGRHFIADLWGHGFYLKDMTVVENILIEAAEKAGATVLSTSFHHFGPGFGFTGTINLAESHVSIHTWPEKDFVAIDIFMCGECDPGVAFEYIKRKFNPDRVVVGCLNRGVMT